MVERGWRGEAKKAVLPFLSFLCHTFPSLLLLSSPTLLYAPLEINFWNFSFVPFQSLCTPGKYTGEGVFLYTTRSKRERREKGVQRMGAGAGGQAHAGKAVS